MHAYGPFTFLLKVSGVLSKHFGELTTGLEEASFFKALERTKVPSNRASPLHALPGLESM